MILVRAKAFSHLAHNNNNYTTSYKALSHLVSLLQKHLSFSRYRQNDTDIVYICHMDLILLGHIQQTGQYLSFP